MISCQQEIFIRHYHGCIMAVGRASLALSRFAALRLSLWFVLYLDRNGD